MTILHGDNIVASRERLTELISSARRSDQTVRRLSGSNLDRATLEGILGNANLFGQQELVVIEQLLSGRVSKKKTDAIKLLADLLPESVIIWEDKSVGKRALGPLGKTSQVKIEEFKLPKTMFAWLDSIGTKPKKQQIQLLHQTLEQEDAYLAFILLIRQIRYLIQVKDAGKIGGAPFMIAKLKRQAEKFSISDLLKIHEMLLQIDLRQKTSQNRLSLPAELDLLLLSM